MKKYNKIIYIILLIIILIIILFIVKQNRKDNNVNTIEQEANQGQLVQELEDKTKLNISTKLNEEKEIDGLKFTNIQLTQQNKQTILLADVTNISENATELKLVDIVFLDREGNEVITVGGIISPLESGEKTQFNTSMTLDYTNVYDFKIIMK